MKNEARMNGNGEDGLRAPREVAESPKIANLQLWIVPPEVAALSFYVWLLA